MKATVVATGTPVPDEDDHEDDDFVSPEVEKAAEAWKARVLAQSQDDEGEADEDVDVLAEGQVVGT